MRRIVRVRAPTGTPVIVYSPFGPVSVPRREPVTRTATSGRPRPTDASVTRPLTVPVACWAVRANGETIASTRRSAPRRRIVDIIRGSPSRVVPSVLGLAGDKCPTLQRDPRPGKAKLALDFTGADERGRCVNYS